jgi:hypothetical protein
MRNDRISFALMLKFLDKIFKFNSTKKNSTNSIEKSPQNRELKKSASKKAKNRDKK